LTALDLVITPPGYTAHLAGALGVKTWLILPSGADWRWNLGKNESLWHQSMQIYRKGIVKNWNELFYSIGVELDRFLNGFRIQSDTATGIQNAASIEPAIIKFPSAEINSRQAALSNSFNSQTIFKLKKAS
jgi:hypothetical protein